MGLQARRRVPCRVSARLLLALIGLVSLLCPAGCLALEPDRRLDQYQHRVFLPSEAGATEVTSLAQTDDGYLWVGSYDGLYRFDGASFELMQSMGGHPVPRLPVVYLLKEPGGGLWITYGGSAGCAYFKDGRYVRLNPEQGWGSMTSGAVDREGVVWAELDHRLVRIDHLRKSELGKDWGLPEASVREVIIDQAGTLWVTMTGDHDVMYLPRGETRFRWLGRKLGAGKLAASSDGTIFVAGASGLSAIVTRHGRPSEIIAVSSQPLVRVLPDRDGGLVAASTTGLYHIGSVRRLLERGGGKLLTSDSLNLSPARGHAQPSVWSMLEDRDGNFWIATNVSLERFRDTRFMPFRLNWAAYTYGVTAGEGGAVWAGNWASGLLKVEDHGKVTSIPGVGPIVSCIYADSTGAIWVAGQGRLWRSDSKREFIPVSIPERMLQPWVRSITVDGSGAVWLVASGLVRGSPYTSDWQTLSETEGFASHPSARVVMTDRLGRVWLGRGSQIMRVEDGRPRAMDSLSAALRVGAIQVLSEHAGRIWIGGLEGVAVVQGEHLLNLVVRDGMAFHHVTGIVETSSGDLWVRGTDDAWHVPAAELRRAIDAGRSEVSAEHFDALDGLDSMAITSKSALTEASDGLLWFATSQGLAWIDPARAPHPAPTPMRYIKSVTIDGKTQDVGKDVTLPSLTHRLEIAYTAIELGYSERIQFRYRMEGFDKDWQAAGTRRVAYYGELPPGEYRFRVSSTDRDGHWHDQDDVTLSVIVAAAWFQSNAFKVACVFLSVGLAILIYQLRIRHLARRLEGQLRQELAERDRIALAKQNERDRIARELHDTLLQGVYGLIWKFHTLAERVRDDPLRTSMRTALDAADRIVLEGRDRVSNLRIVADDSTDLISQFEQAVDETCSSPSIEFLRSSQGAVMELMPHVQAEVVAIGTEALRNAYQHAGADRIELILFYELCEFKLLVRDDGRGIPNDVLRRGRAGHWGLAGMKERAMAIGATLKMSRGRVAGMSIELTVPARVAYVDPDAAISSDPDPLPSVIERGARAGTSRH